MRSQRGGRLHEEEEATELECQQSVMSTEEYV